MKASSNSMRHTLHTWAKTLLVYVEILTVRIHVSVSRDVTGWFNVRFDGHGNKRTSNLPVFKGSTCLLTSMTLSLITTSNHTRLLGMPPQSDKLLDLSGLW